MKLSAEQKVFFKLLTFIAAVVLCTLPFFIIKKDVVYLYTGNQILDTREEGFIRELKNLGYGVKVNSKTNPTPDSIGFWFNDTDYAKGIEASEAKYNFIYREDYFPIFTKDLKQIPIVLTPYRELYEHYMRSNIKSAMFTLGVNTADFYQAEKEKRYSVVYYGDNNNQSTVADNLQAIADVKILGRFWNDANNQVVLKDGNAKERGKELSLSRIVVIDVKQNSPEEKTIPVKIMEATASGALVMAPFTSVLNENYGDNIILYRDAQDVVGLIKHYLQNPKIAQEKTIAAQKITTEKMSASASAKRFHELVTWLKTNQ